MKLILIIALAVLLLAVTCPIDGGSSYFTGTTKTVSGKLLKQYKCASGHVFWVVS